MKFNSAYEGKMLLYIHIPFCSQRCYYCSFNTFTHLNSIIPDYFNALLNQLDYELSSCKKIESIYIGGGTPSLVPAKYYAKLFKLIEKKAKIDANAEITIEANPDSVFKNWLKEIKEIGINRVSIGIQSFDEKKLKFLGRVHSKEEALSSIKMATGIKFKSISIDFIYNTPVDSKKLLENDIATASSFDINHISAYELSIEKNSKFWTQKNSIKTKENFCYFVKGILEKENFLQYEVSNYAKDNQKSFHNLGYWKLKEYIGIGSGAVGFKNKVRYLPPRNPQKYIQNPLLYKKEFLSKEEIKTEKIFLGLRSEIGVEKNFFTHKEIEKIKILINDGKIYQKNGKIFNNNYFLTDEIVLFIII
jgi:oxygen-independent coproporphyrinogen-3 oxidase